MLVECPQCGEPREVQRKPKHGIVCRKCTDKNRKKQPKKEWFRVCETCGDVKKVKTERESKNVKCRLCYDKQNLKERTRVCIDCGDVKVCATKRDAKALRCMSCASKVDMATRPKKPKVQYVRYCVDCGDIETYRYRNKAKKCDACSRKRQELPQGYYDMNEMRYVVKVPPIRHFRICPECEKAVQVKTKAQSGIVRCRDCYVKSVKKEKREKPKKVKTPATKKKVVTKAKPAVKKPKKKKNYKPVGTDGAKRNKVTVKFQTVDLDTFEEIDGSKRKRKEKEIPQTPRGRELQMQEEWLKKNKVKEC